jgi:inner membrane protein
MPSPLAHMAAGYVIYRLSRPSQPRAIETSFGSISAALLLVAAISVLPDVDSVVGIVSGDFGRFHNNVTHSLLAGLVVASGVGFLAARKRWSRFWLWFVVALVGYELHVVMDALTVGRGVMIFWPLSTERFLSPIPLFYGLHWSDGFLSWRHLVTLVSEAAFAAILILLTQLATTFWLRQRPSEL